MPSHQRCQCPRDTFDSPSGAGRFARKAEPRQRWADHMKCIGRTTAEPRWIGQWLDHLLKLDYRAGPSVRDKQRHRVSMRRARVNEMDIEPIERGDELREAVQLCFTNSPIVAFSPIAANVLNPRQWSALTPVMNRLGLRP